MSEQDLNYNDGIPEELLWNPESNCFMKRSLFPGKWIPTRIPVWDADKPQYQYRPGRDRTYQEAMDSISGNSYPGQPQPQQTMPPFVSQNSGSASKNHWTDALPNAFQPGVFAASETSRFQQDGMKNTDGKPHSSQQLPVSSNTVSPDGGFDRGVPAGRISQRAPQPRQNEIRNVANNPDAEQPSVLQNAVTPEKFYGWDVLTKPPLLSTFVVPEPPRSRPGIGYSGGEGPLSQEELELRRADMEPGGFNDQVAKVLGNEGGYVNSRYDRGGATNHGISSGTWKAFAKKHIGVEPTVENLKKLTPEGAKKIYKEEFWKPSKAGEIDDPVIRQLYFDFYINSGRDAAVKNLQRAINQLGGQVDVDGFIGSKTIEALNRLPDPEAIYEQYLKNRIANYHKIADRSDEQRQNLKGWMNRMDKFKSYKEMLKQY